MDEEAAERAAEKLMAAMVEEAQTTKVDPPAHPPRGSVHLTMLTTFTEAAFFQHCPDYDLFGRMHHGVLVNLDECYNLLRMLGLVATDKESCDPNSVTDAASEFNRLVQTGAASLATKASGSFGSAGRPVVSMGLGGNAHPSVIVPMERGEVGSNHATAKKRLLLVTAHRATRRLASALGIAKGHVGMALGEVAPVHGGARGLACWCHRPRTSCGQYTGGTAGARRCGAPQVCRQVHSTWAATTSPSWTGPCRGSAYDARREGSECPPSALGRGR